MLSKNDGEIVELAVRKKNINISELARKMEVNRRTLYNWFQQETLQSSVISSISRAIDCDFSEEYPENFLKYRANRKTDEEGKIGKENEGDRYWIKKYIALLEDYRILLEKYNAGQGNNHQKFLKKF